MEADEKANGGVIQQGFRRKDVLTENLVKESPTLSRLGRITLMVWAVRPKWKVGCSCSCLHAVQLHR